MEHKFFLEAIEIISRYHTSNITINQPINGFVGDLGTQNWTIHIHKCVPAVIESLIKSHFMLSMEKEGLYVTKIF